MLNKKTLSLIVCCFLIFTNVSTALAANPAVSTNFIHTSYSSDYGARSFVYEVGYNGIHNIQDSADVVNSHDFIAYKSYAIYSPEVGNGNANLAKLSLVNASNDNTIQSITSFSNGTHRGFIVPGGQNSITYQLRKSDTSLIGRPDTTGFRIKVTTGFSLPTSWQPNLWSDECRTGAF